MKDTVSKRLTIGDVARYSGVGVETVRFYEREGVISEAPRTAAGYRQFSPETVDRIRFTRRAKELGFSLQTPSVNRRSQSKGSRAHGLGGALSRGLWGYRKAHSFRGCSVSG